MRLFVWWLPFVALSLAAPAAAQDVADAPLRGIGTAGLRTLEPLLERGVVGLVERERFGARDAIHLAAIVDAPAERLFEVLADPAGYPALMPALTEMEVEERSGRSRALAWRWRTAVFELRGHTMMTTLVPPPAQRARGYRVVFERIDGDLGRGREVWRVTPRPDGTSQLTVSVRMDVADANYLTRSMANASRSLSRSVALTLALGTALRIRAEAERRADRAPRALDPGLRPPPAPSAARLMPLLLRGDLFVVEADGDEVGQVSLIAFFSRIEDQVRSVMRHPVAFAGALIGGSEARIEGAPAEDGGIRFDWRVDAPLVGTSGAMVLREDPDGGFALRGVDGALDGGEWRFTTRTHTTAEWPEGAIVTGWARFDPAGAHPLLGAVVDADPAFRAGLAASAMVFLPRAMRVRLRQMRRDEVLPPP